MARTAAIAENSGAAALGMTAGHQGAGLDASAAALQQERGRGKRGGE
jgi:hypothetical protein